jgi:hypothetical protein
MFLSTLTIIGGALAIGTVLGGGMCVIKRIRDSRRRLLESSIAEEEQPPVFVSQVSIDHFIKTSKYSADESTVNCLI